MKVRMILLTTASILFSINSAFAQPVPVFGNNYDTQSTQNVISAGDFNSQVAIRQQIANNSDLLNLNPNVYVQHGLVSYVGKFNTIDQATRLIEIALTTPGVADVDVSGLVDPSGNHVPPDILIVVKIKAALVRSGMFGSDATISSIPVDVETVNVVYLTGKVDSENKAKKVIDIAKSTPGVIKVESDISFPGSPK